MFDPVANPHNAGCNRCELDRKFRTLHDLAVRVLCIGAHPDDCELEFGGTATKMAARGDAVKFVSVTNGEAGHHLHPGPELVERRAREAKEAARRLGIAATEVLPNPDGQLEPRLPVRDEIIRRIRQWQADIVVTHRPWDYHPDHRATGRLVQDSAYMVNVPYVCSDSPALRRSPVFFYLEDGFRKPSPFQADIAVDIDDVWERKLDALDAHASQVYEWLPWVDAHKVPENPFERRNWLDTTWTREPSACTRAALIRRYGPERAPRIHHAEAFELSPYGRQPSPAELDEMFPR